MNPKDKSKAKKEMRKQDGLCVDCGKRPPVLDRLRCRQCLEKHAERMRHRYKERAENGLCTRCGKKAAYAYTFCLKCRLQKNFESAKHYYNHRDQILENARAMRVQRKGQGVCYRCGREIDEDMKLENSGVCLYCSCKRHPGPSKPMTAKEVVWRGGWRRVDPKYFPGMRETLQEANQMLRELWMDMTEDYLTKEGADPKTIKKRKQDISESWLLP